MVDANAREAGKVRGAAEAEAARIYARAYGKDPQFADFFRSLEAYRKVLGRDGDLLVITPDGDFFRYLQKPPQK
jgi:membrane protease subunit HflC